MTTTFHFETNEPQYEYSYEGADVQLRCQGLVAAAAGPAPAFDENVHPNVVRALSGQREANTGWGWEKCARCHRGIGVRNERGNLGECHGGPWPTRARRNDRPRC